MLFYSNHWKSRKLTMFASLTAPQTIRVTEEQTLERERERERAKGQKVKGQATHDD